MLSSTVRVLALTALQHQPQKHQPRVEQKHQPRHQLHRQKVETHQLRKHTIKKETADRSLFCFVLVTRRRTVSLQHFYDLGHNSLSTSR